MGNLPPRKAASVNVSPVGDQGGNPQANIMPQHRTAAPFGSVDKSVYTRRPSGAGPMAQPVNDKDAGRGTGNVRGSANSGGVDAWKGID